MKNFVNNKLVNIDALRAALKEEFKNLNKNAVFSSNDVIQSVDEFVQINVERQAFEACEKDKNKDDIYDVIDNVNDLRDLQNEIVDNIKEILGMD